MAGEIEVLPGANVLAWSATGFNRMHDYVVSFEATWTHVDLDADKKTVKVTEPIPLDPVPLQVPKDYKYTPSPQRWGEVTGTVDVVLPDKIRYGTCNFKLTFDGKAKAGTATSQATFVAQPWKVVEDLVKLEVQPLPGKTLPPRRDKDKPVVFFGLPFNLAWSVKPARRLVSISLKGVPPGARALGGAGPFEARVEAKGVEELSLAGTEPKEFKLSLDLRDESPIVDPWPPEIVVQARPLNWQDLPVRKGSRIQRAKNAAPKFLYRPNSPAPPAAGDAAALVARINDKRKQVPRRPFILEYSSRTKDSAGGEGRGNVYYRDGNTKLPNPVPDPAPQAAASRTEGLTPTVTYDSQADKDHFELYRTRLYDAEGNATTITALVVDGELTLGTGYATSGPSVVRILDDVFKADEAVRATAFELGLAVVPDGDALQLQVADTTSVKAGDPTPALLTGDDARNYISCDLDLLSFFANLAIGAQPDLRDGAAPPADAAAAAKAQRQVWLDAQWTEAQKVWFVGVPGGYSGDALFLIVHSHGAGHGFAGWGGDRAGNSATGVADAVWEKLKRDRKLNLAQRYDVAHAICQSVPAAAAQIEARHSAELGK